ncbi:MAG: 50S ribosomal protein L31e [Candidatus Hadarchaeales archaeon]
MPEERIYVIPLRDVKDAPRNVRAKRAAVLVRDFLRRHMKAEVVRLDGKLNERLWGRSIQKPGSRVRVRAVKEDDGTVNAFLAE